MQNSEYFKLGVLTAMALAHGVGGFNLFCSTVYNFMSGTKTIDLIPIVEEVPDPAIREELQQVRDGYYTCLCVANNFYFWIESCGDVNLLQKLCMDNIDLLVDCGFNKLATGCFEHIG